MVETVFSLHEHQSLYLDLQRELDGVQYLVGKVLTWWIPHSTQKLIFTNFYFKNYEYMFDTSIQIYKEVGDIIMF